MPRQKGCKRPPGAGIRKGTKIRRLKDWPSAWWLSRQDPAPLQEAYQHILKRSQQHAATWHKRQAATLLERARLKYGSVIAGGPKLDAQYDSEGILTLYRIEPDGTLTPILDHGIELAGY